jgi:hypothetical protein
MSEVKERNSQSGAQKVASILKKFGLPENVRYCDLDAIIQKDLNAAAQHLLRAVLGRKPTGREIEAVSAKLRSLLEALMGARGYH